MPFEHLQCPKGIHAVAYLSDEIETLTSLWIRKVNLNFLLEPEDSFLAN